MNYQLDPDELAIDYKYNTYNGVMALCEFHDDHTPSMLVNLYEGNYYCFACGAYGDIDKLLTVTGGNKKYIRRKVIVWNDDNGWLKKLGYNLAYGDDYVKQRGITHEQIEKFQIRSNDKEVILPMFDSFGMLTGVKVRVKNPSGGAKYFTFGKTPFYYGNCNPLEVINKKVIVTEGIIGMLHFDRVGRCAISTISANRSTLIEKIVENSSSNFIVIFDDDYAGYMGALKLLYKTQIYERTFIAPFCDVDELSEKKLLEVGKSFKSYIDNTEDLLYYVQSKLSKELYDKFYKSFQRWLKYQ